MAARAMRHVLVDHGSTSGPSPPASRPSRP
jgi:hypothetical protein